MFGTSLRYCQKIQYCDPLVGLDNGYLKVQDEYPTTLDGGYNLLSECRTNTTNDAPRYDETGIVSTILGGVKNSKGSSGGGGY